MSHALVVCNERFNGKELWTLLATLHRYGHTFDVVSTVLSVFDEETGEPFTLSKRVDEVTVDDIPRYDVLCIVSGHIPHTKAYWKHRHLQKLVGGIKARNGVLAAICCAVPSLGRALEGHRVSCFPMADCLHQLGYNGAEFTNVSLTVDRKVITGEYPPIAEMWAEEICAALVGRPPIYNLQPSSFKRKGIPRHMPKHVQEMIDAARPTQKS